MSVRRVRNHGEWVWRARIAYRGIRKAAVRPTKQAALDTEAELRRELRARADTDDRALARPSTVRDLLAFYEVDLRARRKHDDVVARVGYLQRKITACMPPTTSRPRAR